MDQSSSSILNPLVRPLDIWMFKYSVCSHDYWGHAIATKDASVYETQ